MVDHSATSTGETTVEAVDGSNLLRSPEDDRARGLEPGEVVDDVYRVEDAVGTGAMGMVYRARDLELDRVVALKLQRASDERATARLLREARAMAKLAHPHVITVHGVGLVDDQVYIAMEYVDGGTLRAWLREERPIDEILETFAQAGQGLAAAHAEGLVHRDFKPENVLVGSDGRVRVADFGLVRGRGESEDGSIETSQRLQSLAGSSVDVRLTVTGAMAGTPAYMAPEQYWGGAVDERADQFAFCVALYEALYREHPFGGRTPSELLTKIMAEAVKPAPSRTRVPARLRRPLLRGMSANPQDRFPSMRALLGRLRLDGGQRRRRLALVGVGAAALMLGASASALFVRAGPEEASPCADTAAAVDEVWNERTRAALTSDYHETGLSFADDLWRAAAGELDRYVFQWKEQRVEACQATRVRGEASDLMLERRNACLDRRLLALGSLLDALESPNLRTVSDTPKLVEELPDLARCQDPAYLEAELEPPPPDQEASVRQIRTLLADAEARRRVGDYAGASQRIGEAKTLVERVDHGPVEVEVTIRDAKYQAQIDADAEGASRKLREAYFRARQLRHHDAAAEAALLLANVEGYQQQRAELGRVWAALGESELRLRGGLGPDEQIHLRHLLAAVEVSVGNYDESIELTREALAIALESAPRYVPAGHLRLAAVLDEQGSFEEAKGHYEEGLRLREELRGANSPELIGPLGNASLNALDRGELKQAEALVRRAEKIAVTALGPKHPDVAEILLNVGVILSHGGDHAGSKEEWERALAILLDAPDPNDSTIALLYSNLGIATVEEGDIEGGLEFQRKAMRHAAEHLGEDHPDYALYVFNTANALYDLERFDEALTQVERACELTAAIQGEKHWRTYNCQVSRGRTLRELGRLDESLSVLEVAVRGLADVGAPPNALADAQRGLAVTLGKAGEDRKRQRQLLEQALEVFESHGLEGRIKEAKAYLARLQ